MANFGKKEIVYINIDELKPNEYNPKKLTPDEERLLEESIKEFGLQEPLVVNSNPKRKNIIIGGHQRLKILKKLGYKEVPCWLVDIDDVEKEKKLCLYFSKAIGSWDLEKLKLLDMNLLASVGFTETELLEIGLIKLDLIEPEIKQEVSPKSLKSKQIVCPNCQSVISL